MTVNTARTYLVAAALVAVSLACGSSEESGIAATGSKSSALRTAALSDDFNGFDTSVWEKANWANGNPFNCGFSPNNVAFSNGTMSLKLDNVASSGKSYSGGEYRTIDTFSYGRFEVRMRAAKASGIVSSFFTYTGSPWDEIDIEFLGKNTSQVQFNYYVNGTGGHEKIVDLGFDASAALHTYAFDWRPDSISWYVDGVLKHSVSGGTLPSHPMQIMMNLWNGIGVDSWLGSFSYSSPLYAYYDSVTYTPAGTGTCSSAPSAPTGVSATATSSSQINLSWSAVTAPANCSVTYNVYRDGTKVASGLSGTSYASTGLSASTTYQYYVVAVDSAGASANSTTVSATTLQNGGGNPNGILINAGGSAVGSFVADSYYSGGSTYTTSNTIDTSLITGTVPPQAVLQSERYGEFTYTIPGLTAGGAYTVALYFEESYFTSSGQRAFNVAINGTTVLSNFDIYAAAGGVNKAIAKKFSAIAGSSGQIVIAFSNGTANNPKISGIAVTSGTGGDGGSYNLTVTKTGNGTVTGGGINCGSTCGASISAGTSVTLTASPGSNSTFVGWGGACSGTATTCTVAMGSDQTVTAAFNTSDGGSNCTTLSNGQGGNFNTTEAVCYTINSTVRGWGCANADGRTVTVNGTAVACGKMPLPGSAPYTFNFSAGSVRWASFYWW